MTTRRIIRHAIVDLIKAAGTSMGTRVHAYKKEALAQKTLPAVLVVFVNEPIAKYSQSPERYLRTAIFAIVVLQEKSQAQIEDDLDDAMREVELALWADADLGGILKENMMPVEVDQQISEDLHNKFGEVALTVECRYLDDLPAAETMDDLDLTTAAWDLHPRDGSEDGRDNIMGGQNPRLYFDAGDVAGLLTKATSTHTTEAARLTTYAGTLYANMDDWSLPEELEASMPAAAGDWHKFGNYLHAAAGAYLVTADPSDKASYLTYCMNSMDRLESYALWGPSADDSTDLAGSHILTGFAFAYDALYQFIDADRQESFGLALRAKTEAFKVAQELGTIRWANNHQNNINHMAMFAMAAGALAYHPKDPVWADGVLDLVEVELGTTFELRALHGSALSNEGPAYMSLASHGLISAVWLLARHRRTDWTADASLGQITEAVIHAGFSDWQKVVGYADNDSVWYEGPQHLLRWVAAQGADGKAQWLADHLWGTAHGAKNGGAGVSPGLPLWFEFLWYDPTVVGVAVDSASEPAMKHFTDFGLVTWHDAGFGAAATSAWTKSGHPTGASTWALAKASDPRMAVLGAAHEHPTDGMVAFIPSGKLFLVGGVYPKPKRTALGNVPTFTPVNAIDPVLSNAAVDAVWELAAEAQIGQRGEVGQIGEWAEWYGPAAKLLSELPEPSVLFAEGAGGHLFAQHDLTTGYPTTYDLAAGGAEAIAMTQLLRSVLVKGGLMIVVDHLEVSKTVTFNEYFRTVHRPAEIATIGLVGQVATFTVDGDAHTLTADYPASGLTVTEDREVLSYEDAVGVNDRQVTDWSILSRYSRYAKFSKSVAAGEHAFVFSAVGSGATASILSVVDTDPLGLTIRFDLEGTTWVYKVTRSLDPSDRQTFLGDPALYYTLAVE